MLAADKIKKILVVSLSNIGDIVLTFPVIDILKRDFPDAQLDLIVGPNGESLVCGNPYFRKVFVYHKSQSPLSILKWLRELAAEKYDLAVDLRNTAIPFLIFAKHKTPLMIVRPKVGHMREQHLARLKSVHNFTSSQAAKISLFISSADEDIVLQFLKPLGSARKVVFAPGSRAESKRWQKEGFAKLADYLIEHYGVQVVFTGDQNDVEVVSKISTLMKNPSLDLTGKLTLPQSAYVLSLSDLAIVNDSAPMHLASYLNVPVVALFGPTDPKRYGPWSGKCAVVRNNDQCLACRLRNKVLHTCMQAIRAEDVEGVLENFLPEIFDANTKR
jgi:lipopolysaccharide heptosyltransferase II